MAVTVLLALRTAPAIDLAIGKHAHGPIFLATMAVDWTATPPTSSPPTLSGPSR
jgi:hypothetical protein